MKYTKYIPWVVVSGLALALIFTTTAMLQAKYDLSVSAANIRAEQATTQRWKTQAENAATRFQLQMEINQDSLQDLETALGAAIREQELTVRALQRTELAFEAVQASNQALVSMMNTVSPSGRPERLEVFVLDEDSVETNEQGDFTELPVVGEIVVAIPQDPEIDAEIETVLSLLPFEIETGIACTPEKDAVAIFQTPGWMTASPRLGVVEPEVCHGPRPNLFLGMELSVGNLALGGAVGAGLALLLTAVF
jgi:hypothetical protein